MAADEEEGPDDDALAAEWEAMAGGDDDYEGEIGAQPDTGAVPGAASERVLDQEEIDSLLGFDDKEVSNESKGIRSIIDSALVSYERLPMLEVVFDRLIRIMTTTMRNFTSDNVEVAVDNFTSIRFGEYIKSIPMPAMLAVYKAEEWDNYGLLVLDSSLIYSIVDVLLGGRRGTAAMAIEGRPFTTIESRLVERLVSVVLRDMEAAFEPLSPVKFVFSRLETNPRFATIVRPSNAAVLMRLRVDMEDRGGRMEVLLPYVTLEPVRELLLQMFMGEKFGHDSIWESHLAGELLQTQVSVQAVLDEQQMNLSDVLNWKIGSQLQLSASPRSSVQLRFGDVAMFDCRMGRRGQNIAVQVEGPLRGAG